MFFWLRWTRNWSFKTCISFGGMVDLWKGGNNFWPDSGRWIISFMAAIPVGFYTCVSPFYGILCGSNETFFFVCVSAFMHVLILLRNFLSVCFSFLFPWVAVRFSNSCLLLMCVKKFDCLSLMVLTSFLILAASLRNPSFVILADQYIWNFYEAS